MAMFRGTGEMLDGRRPKAFVIIGVILAALIMGAGFAVEVTVDSPANGTVPDTTPDLNFTVNESSNVTYSWNGEGNISGCRNCTSYNTTYGEYANSSEQNLSAVWHFNENFGNTTYDDSANGNNGTLGNATGGTQPAWTTGRFGPGLNFDGANDFVNISYNASLDVLDGNKPFTFAIWFKLDELGSASTLFSQADGGGAGKSWLLITPGNNPKTWLGSTLTGTSTFNQDQWYFVVLSYNGTFLEMHINGTLDTSGTIAVDDNADGAYYIGTQNTVAGAWFNGTIDEIMLFDRSLSVAEIQELYNGTLPDAQHNVTVYATNTTGDTNTTTRLFTVDTTAPTYSNDADDSGGSVAEGAIVNVSVLWGDNIALDWGVLRTNKTGTWLNETWMEFNTTPEWFNTTINTTGYSGFTICWNQWTNDTADNWNDTMSNTIHCFDVTAAPDTAPPTWSNNWTDTVPTYDSNTLSLFNITWTDTTGVDTVYIEGNWSGSPANYSMWNDGGVYKYNTTLPAGDFYWKSWANDTEGNPWNVSDTWYFAVSKASTTTQVVINGSNSPAAKTYGDVTNQSANVSNGDVGNLTMYRNGTSITIDSLVTLAAGAYNYSAYYSGNENYSASSDENVVLTINKASSSVYLYLNDSRNNFSMNPGEYLNATAVMTTPSTGALEIWTNYSDGTDKLWDNGSDYVENVTTLDVEGYYWFKANWSGNTNYTSDEATFYVSVSAADITPPTYSSVGRNSTEAGASTLFSAYWQDSGGLSNYTFSWNDSGTWTSETYNMTGTANWSNITKALNSTAGITIGWRIYANDSANNENDTGIQVLTTTDETPPDIYLESPANDDWDDDGDVTFSYNVTDDSSIVNCSLVLNGGINQTNTSITKDTTQNFSSTNLGFGIYNWSVNCFDLANNTNSSETRILVVNLSSEFGGNTTDLGSVPDISNIPNFVLDNPIYGKINFSVNVDLSAGADLDKHVNISQNRIFINSSALPALNKNATLYLYSLGLVNPQILRDGSPCQSSICTEIDYNASTGNLTFNVTQFSIYSARETPTTPPSSNGGGGCSHRLAIEELQVLDATVGGTAVLSVAIGNTGCAEKEILVWVSTLPSGWSAENKTIDIPSGSVTINLTLRIPASEEPGRRSIIVELTPKYFVGAVRKELMVGVKSAAEAPATTTTTVRTTTTTAPPTTTSAPTTTVPSKTTAPPPKGIPPVVGKVIIALAAIGIIAGGAYFYRYHKRKKVEWWDDVAESKEQLISDEGKK